MRRKEVYQQIKRLYDNRAAGISRIQRRNDMFQLFMILAVATSLVRQTQPVGLPVRLLFVRHPICRYSLRTPL